MKKILGIDFGKKRIGLAISDTLKTIAVPLETIHVSGDLKQILVQFEKAIADRIHSLEKIIIGLPLHLNGTESEMSALCREFASLVEEKLLLPVELVDERFSSSQADNDLRRIGVNRKKRTKYLDCASASLVLQSFLDRL